MAGPDRKSTRLNSSHTVIYTLSLHDALPILGGRATRKQVTLGFGSKRNGPAMHLLMYLPNAHGRARSEEHTSELQSHRDLHSFPTRRSSDLGRTCHAEAGHAGVREQAERPGHAPADVSTERAWPG